MRANLALVFVAVAGCYPPTAVPTAMHPTASANDPSVGVALGGSYIKQEDSSLINVPHAEGWIRRPVTPGGQVGIHVAPNVVHGTFRYDVAPVANGVGFAVEPMIGGSYFRYHNQPADPMQAEEKESTLTMMIGIVPTLLFPTGSGFGYVSAKVGFQSSKNLDAQSGQDDTTNSYVVGVSAGIDVGNGVSLELAVHRLDDAEDEVMDSPAVWLVVPTIGFRR